MRSAFIDDSAKEPNQGPAFVLAGWVAAKTTWSALEVDWKNALKEHRAPPFHHTNLRARKKGYEAFDHVMRDALLGDLVSVIEAHVLDGYLVTLHHASFAGMWSGVADKLTREQRRRLYLKAFVPSFHAMVQTIFQDSRDRGIVEPFDLIMSSQDREVLESVEMLEQWRPDLPAESQALLGSITTKSQDAVGLQAADLLASRIALNLRTGTPCDLQRRMVNSRRIATSAVGPADMKPYIEALGDIRRVAGV